MAEHKSNHLTRSRRLDPFFNKDSRVVSGLNGAAVEFSRDPLVLEAYSQDLWPRKLLELREQGPPDEPLVEVVFWPETSLQVSEVVKWASSLSGANCAIYPYGAGSGVCGATIPAAEEERPRVVIDLKRMRRIRSLDLKSMTVWAEAGWIGENLERHLNQDGLTLGHFPSSIYCSSLGGYLATRSAGQLSTKYGKIEDLVLALEMVLPDGSIVETGRAPRSAMGPDWTQLLLGTEGTLGLFTAACLQVQKLPEVRVMRGYGAQNLTEALTFARSLMQDGLRPSALRIYDELETSLTLSSFISGISGISGNSAVALVVIFEGRRKLTELEATECAEIAVECGITDLGPELGEHWWKHRYDVSYKQQLILSHKRMILDTFELAATWDKLDDVYKAVKAVKVGCGVIMAHFSHFYHTGANIYFTLVSYAGVGRVSSTETYDNIWSHFLEAAHGAGATLSHHHGAGALKKKWIAREQGLWTPIFEKVKRGFDPENRFNPDKMGL